MAAALTIAGCAGRDTRVDAVSSVRGASPALTCSAPPVATGGPDRIEIPVDAQEHCDQLRGWRMFAWIGASGDGIVRVEHATATWQVVAEGPFCANGVAMATPSQLGDLGMPVDLAGQWGFSPQDCSP